MLMRELYLEAEDVDVGHEFPVGFAVLVVALEAESTGIADHFAQYPGVIVLEPGDQGCTQDVAQLG